MPIQILFIADIVGRPGRNLILKHLQQWKTQYQLDFIFANAENAAGGMGLTKALAIELHKAGIDGITLGNHVWDQNGFSEDINHLPFVCRPANLAVDAPGASYLTIEKNNFKVSIFTLLARHNMAIAAQNSSAIGDNLIHTLSSQCDAILIEIHAELTAEKQIHGYYFDGRATAIFGTHTHVPTDDVRILPKGSAFQTDVGMTGIRQSIIGFDPEPILTQIKDGLPRRWKVAEGEAHLDGLILTLDPHTKQVIQAKRVEWKNE